MKDVYAEVTTRIIEQDLVKQAVRLAGAVADCCAGRDPRLAPWDDSLL